MIEKLDIEKIVYSKDEQEAWVYMFKIGNQLIDAINHLSQGGLPKSERQHVDGGSITFECAHCEFRLGKTYLRDDDDKNRLWCSDCGSQFFVLTRSKTQPEVNGGE